MTGGYRTRPLRTSRAHRVALLCAAGCMSAQTAGAQSNIASPALDMLPPPPLSATAASGPTINRPWVFTATGGTELTFTDNVFLTNTNRQSDWIFSPRAAFDLRGTSSHAGLNASVDVAYDFYAQHSRLNGVRPHALIDGYVQPFGNSLTIDAHVATNLREVDQAGRAPSTVRSFGENQTQVLTYGISPRFEERLGNFAKISARYDFSAVDFFDSPAASTASSTRGLGDSRRHVVQAEIANAKGFQLLEWGGQASYEKSNYTANLPVSERAAGQGRLQYNTTGKLALTARGGYDWISEPTLAQSPDGAYGLAGILWRPGPRTSVRVEAGYRYRDFNGEAEITYRRSAVLNFNLVYRRDVQTTQRLLIQGLSGVTRDEAGNLIDAITGLPPDLNNVLFGLTNQAFTRDVFQAGVNGSFGRNFYNVRGSYEHRDANGLSGNSYQADALIGRRVTPRVQASAQISYNKTRNDPGVAAQSDSETTAGSVRVDYRLGPTITTGIKYIHMNRSTTSVSYRENVAVLSISKVF
jgi:uncharacterized protein (PEP-CTERM system associated)